MYALNIECNENELKPIEGELKNRTDSFLKELGFDSSFSINFISDDQIQTMNKEYRDIDRPTDVLTFRLDDDDTFPCFDEEEKEAGDIFVSLDSVKRNANEFGVSTLEEVSRVMLHGILHLMGYDHESNDFKVEKMLIKQEDVLKRLNYSS